LKKIWTENRIPDDWYKRITVPIYKKGDMEQYGNHKGITFLCQTLKIYERILVYKMTLEIKGKLAELFTFRKGMANTDLIFGIQEYGK
jgi:hypothetical protein